MVMVQPDKRRLRYEPTVRAELWALAEIEEDSQRFRSRMRPRRRFRSDTAGRLHRRGTK